MSNEDMSKEMAVKEQHTGGELVTTLRADDVLAKVALVQEIKEKLMVEGEDYGVIPGCKLPTLKQSGAEKLCMAFRLVPDYDLPVVQIHENGHRTVTVKCKINDITGRLLGAKYSSCSTLETKYRFRKGERICPKCGVAAIIKGKDEYGGGWLCFKKKEGCGAKFPDGAPEIEEQETCRIEYDNPADYYQTVLMMAQKRSHVATTRQVTAASSVFTQDVEDLPEFGEDGKPKKKSANKKAPADNKKPTTQKTTSPLAGDPPPSAGNGEGNPGVFDNWTPEQCREACEKSPELKAVVMKHWKEKIQTYANLVNIFNGCGGDQAAIMRELQSL